MVDIISEAGLIAELTKIANEAIAGVSEKALNRLHEQIIKDVYEFDRDYWPNHHYYNDTKQPTYQFLTAWRLKDIKYKPLSVSREIFFDPTMMEYEPENFLHGSMKYGDNRDTLMDDLNVAGIAKRASFKRKERQPYWNNFIYEMLDEGDIDYMFQDELSNFGVEPI